MASKNNLPKVGFNWDKIASNMQEQNASSIPNATAPATTNPGTMSVDTLTQKPDPVVDTAVNTVKDYNKRGAAPSLNAESNKSSATPPPEPTKVNTEKDYLRETAKEIAGFDLASERQKARKDAMVSEKEAVQRTEYNALTKLKEEKRRRVEEIQMGAGLTKAQKDAAVAQESRVFDRQIADKSFTYNVALGDYQAAEKIATEYISDLQADQSNKQNTWQMLYNLVQNDMTESEKVAAQQAFETKKMQEQFELNKKMALFEAGLKSTSPDAPITKEINGQTMQWNPTTSEWVKPAISVSTPDKIANETEFADVSQKVAQLDAVLADPLLIKNITGVLQGSLSTFLGAEGYSPISPLVSGKAPAFGGATAVNKKNDALNTISYFIDNYTLDNLKKAKADGVSFGALSEKELEMIASASTRLGAAAKDKKTGKLEGFSGSPAQVQKDLELIQGKLKAQQDQLNRNLLDKSEELEIINIK